MNVGKLEVFPQTLGKYYGLSSLQLRTGCATKLDVSQSSQLLCHRTEGSVSKSVDLVDAVWVFFSFEALLLWRAHLVATCFPQIK